MTDSYNVGYSVDALGDLRKIYSYIANELLVPETAAAQLGRIRKEVRSLDFMPARYTLVEWEPWHSMKMHQLPVDNFIVYYLVDDKRGQFCFWASSSVLPGSSFRSFSTSLS